jgi:hypothetical protein
VLATVAVWVISVAAPLTVTDSASDASASLTGSDTVAPISISTVCFKVWNPCSSKVTT